MFEGLLPLLRLLTAAWAMLASPAVERPDAVAGGSSPGSTVADAPVPSIGHGPDIARPLPFFYDLYTFRGNGGGTDVVAAYAIPVGSLERDQHGGEVRYRFDVSLVLADTARQTVYRSDDSVYVGVPRPLANDHLLHTHVQVRAPPSSSVVQRVVMTDVSTPGIGQLYTSFFPVPDYSGSRLMLSDVALGMPGTEAGWRRGDVTLALLPTSQFPESAFDVYYEVYNLPFGNRYATEIAIEPVDDEGERQNDEGRTVRIRFAGESAARPDGTLGELRAVESSLAEGSYRITVTVTDEDTGRTASRWRLLEVRGWRPGTTLVTARPVR